MAVYTGCLSWVRWIFGCLSSLFIVLMRLDEIIVKYIDSNLTLCLKPIAVEASTICVLCIFAVSDIKKRN